MLLLVWSCSSESVLACSSSGFFASGNLDGESREKASFLFRKLSGVVDTPEVLLLLPLWALFREEGLEGAGGDEVVSGSAGGGDALLVLGMSCAFCNAALDDTASFFAERFRFPEDELLPCRSEWSPNDSNLLLTLSFIFDNGDLNRNQ